MKKLLLFLASFLFLPAVFAQSVPPASQFHTITESWTAPVSWNGTGSSVPCSATITTYCVSSYTETLTPPPGVPGGSVILSVSGVSNAWAPGGALYCGTWGVSVVANWMDGNGSPASSLPLTGTVAVTCPFTASPATGLSSKVS